MKIILANGTELNPIIVTGHVRYVQGINRDTLSFVFPEDTQLEEIEALFTEANCESITIVEGDNEYIHKEYTIFVELARKPVEVASPTDESDAVYENRVIIIMAQRTYAECQLVKNTDALNALLTGEE